jgi:hypothetical protein
VDDDLALRPPNKAVERTAGSRALAAAAHRERYPYGRASGVDDPNHPKQDLSMSIHMADLAFFVKAALILIPIGLILLGIGYALPRSDSDEDVLL